MIHEAKDFSHLAGNLDGISDTQLQAHFGLYQGYVKKLNEVEEKLKTADPSGGNYSFNEFSELKRRWAVPFNGTYLHQLYFENLAKDGGSASDELSKAIIASFGSLEKYLADLRGTASSTPGWVLTAKNKRDGLLHNHIMFEHHIGLPVDQEVILALDCWEHAFMVDYSTKKADYLAAFVKNINWKIANERFKIS